MDKDEFWKSLDQMNAVVDLPWCIIGDFNELAAPSEKERWPQLLSNQV